MSTKSRRDSSCFKHVDCGLKWAGLLMGDDIGSGSVCFDFRSTNVVQLSNWKYVVYGHLTIIDKSLLLDPNRWHYPFITYLNPCLSKSWTQLFLKRPKSYLVGNGSWSPISMLDLRPNKQTSKPGRRKVPNEVPSSIEYWIEEEEKKIRQIEMEVEEKTRQIEKEVEKKCRKLLID